MRSIVIGDIHGYAGAMEALIRKTGAEPAEDRIIFLGDLFDRGPESREVFQKVKEIAAAFGDRFVLLTGNHEDYLMAEKLTIRERLVWERVGRNATVRSFRAHGEKMEDCRPWLKEHCQSWFLGDGFQCVHAGIRAEPIEENDRETLIHDHYTVPENKYNGPLTITGHIAIGVATWFRGDGEHADSLIYGEWHELPTQGVICIDTGCGKGGWLTGMIIEDGRFRLEQVGENSK